LPGGSQKYRTIVPVSVGQNTEPLTHALPGITIIFSRQRDKVLDSPDT